MEEAIGLNAGSSGSHWTDKWFGVHQVRPSQHFNGEELVTLLQDVQRRIWPIWLEENNHNPVELVGKRYDFTALGCFIDEQGLWRRHVTDAYCPRLNILDYAFWRTREEICRGLLEIAHLRNLAVRESGVVFISAESELKAHLYDLPASEETIDQPIEELSVAAMA